MSKIALDDIQVLSSVSRNASAMLRDTYSEVEQQITMV